MREPRILIFDIETSPNVGLFWSAGHKISVSTENIIQERQVICIAYKWLGQKSVHCLSWDKKKKGHCDSKMLKKFCEIYSEADAVVGHNGDNFDIKWLQTRLMLHDLDPLPVVHQVDTLKEFRKNFRLNSNRLDYVAKLLTGGGKNPMTFDDWKKVMEGNKTVLKKMVRYCKKDVQILEEVYNRTKRYFKNHGISGAMKGSKEVCPDGCEAPTQKWGTYMTKAGKYQKYRCAGCAKTWRDTRMLKE